MKTKEPPSDSLPSKRILVYALSFFVPLFVLILWMVQNQFRAYFLAFFGDALTLEYAPTLIIMLWGTLLLGWGIYEALLKLTGRIATIEAQHARDKKLQPYALIWVYLTIGALATPIAVSPLMGYYVSSKGYERCTNSQSPLSRAQIKRWVKAPADCTYWELWLKDQEATLKRYEEDGVWLQIDTVN